MITISRLGSIFGGAGAIAGTIAAACLRLPWGLVLVSAVACLAGGTLLGWIIEVLLERGFMRKVLRRYLSSPKNHQMNKVNLRDLSVLSQCIHMSAEETRIVHSQVDPNDERSVKSFISNYIVPLLSKTEARLPGYILDLKLSMRYYLTKGGFSDESVFYDSEPAFAVPANLLNYYRWAWEAIFPGEDYALEALEEYTEAA